MYRTSLVKEKAGFMYHYWITRWVRFLRYVASLCSTVSTDSFIHAVVRGEQYRQRRDRHARGTGTGIQGSIHFFINCPRIFIFSVCLPGHCIHVRGTGSDMLYT